MKPTFRAEIAHLANHQCNLGAKVLGSPVTSPRLKTA